MTHRQPPPERLLRIRLAERTSDYWLSPGARDGLPARLGAGPAVALVDRGVWRAHAPALRRVLRAADGSSLPLLLVPGGEAAKRAARLAQVWRWLAARQLPRDGTLVAVGGGAVLDLAGLAAATWQRGVRFVALPTTLLGMVDAAIGGKTAIDVGMLKNGVGAFHPASDVLADPRFLATLPRRQWRCGLAEAVKAAVIGSPGLFRDLERHAPSLARAFAGPRRGREDRVGSAALALPWPAWIARAARVKAAIVSRDFREQGPRRALNLGHTLGHAIESAGGWSHGEAVAIGMATAAALAARRGLCPAVDAGRIHALLRACGLPVVAALPPRARLARLIAGDKKRLGGRVRWVLPAGIGAVRLDESVDLAELREAMRD